MLLLLLILHDHHQQRTWVSPTPLSLFPLLYHLVQIFSWSCVIFSMFISKSCSFFFFFLKFFIGRSKQEIFIAEWKRHPEKLVVENWSLIDFFGELCVGGGDVCRHVIFWGRFRTCFPAKDCLFYEIRKLKEEEEWKEKQLLIRPLKMCLLFFKKCFTWESVNFSGSFLQFFYLEILISTYSKDRICVEMAQICKNLIFNFFPDFYNTCQHFTKYIEGCLNVLTFISSLYPNLVTSF
jgi:hypothetical protein